MAHNFIKQIDTITDDTGNTPLSNTQFYSSNGLGSNAGTDPNNPRQDPFTDGVTQSIAVLGSDQIYSSLVTGKSYMGDGIAIFDGLSVNSISATLLSSEDLHFRNYVTLTLSSNGDNSPIHGVIFESNGSTVIQSAQTSAHTVDTYKNAFFKNTDITNQGSNSLRFPHRVSRSVFYSDQSNTYTLNDYGTSKVDSQNSNVIIGYEIVCSQDQIELFNNCYLENCSFNIDGTPYANLTALQAAIPTACPNAITSGSSFVGSMARNEYKVVSTSSTLLGAGVSGANIGGFNIGIVFNESNVSSSTNVTFTSGAISLTNPASSGQIVWQEEAPRTLLNPILKLNGTPDFVNNLFRVIQSPQPDLPAKLTCNIETRTVDGSFVSSRVFRFGFPIEEDFNNKPSGEDDYHAASPLQERMYEFRITLDIQP